MDVYRMGGIPRVWTERMYIQVTFPRIKSKEDTILGTRDIQGERNVSQTYLQEDESSFCKRYASAAR